MKGVISKSLMLQKISIAFLFLMLINSFAFSQRRNFSSLSLDTTCVFENDPVLIDLDIDSDELIEADNKSFTIFSIDSLRYNFLMRTAAIYVDTTINNQIANNISDSQLVINGNKFHYLFSSEEQLGEGQIINGDTTIFAGILPEYWGMISKLNLAIVSLVDISGAYATTNLIDLKSGKIIQDISSYDNGTLAYFPNKAHDYIISCSNGMFEEDESEVVIVKVQNKNKKFCLDLAVIINLKKQHVLDLSWVDKKSFCFSSVKHFEGLEQYNFYEVKLK